LGPSSLSKYSVYLWEAPENFVLHLENPAGFRNRHARQRRWHVEENTFIEWRHELRPQTEIHWDGDRHRDDCSRDRLPPVLEYKLDDGVINLHQRPADGVVFLVVDLADSNCVGHLGQPGRPKLEFLQPDE